MYLYRAHCCRQPYKTVTKVNDITLLGVRKLTLISTAKILSHVVFLQNLSVLHHSLRCITGLILHALLKWWLDSHLPSVD